MAEPLSENDKETWEWQLDVPGFGEEGQATLRNTTALISRAGGLGGPLAFSLAAAGFGKLIIAHGGTLRANDLNRQILMKHDGLGQPRVDSIQETLQRYNPAVEVETVDANITPENAEELVSSADIVFGCAPLFEERFLMNRFCVEQGKPYIDSAMYGLEGQVLNVLPGDTPCLACVYPEIPPHWKRRFPVIGAVSALTANIGVMEGIKVLTHLAPPTKNKMIYVNTKFMTLQKIAVSRREDCDTCGHLASGDQNQ